MRIALITHCEASHSLERKVGGWYNSTLTENGRKQAAQLEERLKTHGFDLEQSTIYTSDLKRAAQTAEILTQNHAVNPIFDPRLREMSFGTHEGMNQKEHLQIMKPLSPTGDRLNHAICEGAESRRQLANRIYEFLDVVWPAEKDLILVTHGFAATFVIAAFQKIEISSMGFISYQLNPGSISILEEDALFKNRTLSLLNG